MARSRYVRRSGGKADGGSAWISYSDMMAALLLVFVLILCYSLYQYFSMLETKTAELDRQSAQLSAQQLTLNAQQLTLDEQQGMLEAQKTTLDEQQVALAAQQIILSAQEEELSSALTQLDEQRSLLADQALTLEEQQRIILAAQLTLDQKEAELAAANIELTQQQNALANATILLGEQQKAMDLQQRRLDVLVGVRTKIVRELTAALASANLNASVDPNTGDIMLESTVFFDRNRNNIKPEGEAFLQEFIPVYLGALMKPEYLDYLGEIIIEGHTDSSGDYMLNLEISQQRALSVAEYCLGMTSLGREKLQTLQSILTVKGRSESDLIYDASGREDMAASRRVEFKFRMKDSEMIDEIRSILSADDG